MNLWTLHPPVGVFIAILALIGVLVPWFRGTDVKPREKAFWTAIMFLLVGLEIRSITLDHNEQEALRHSDETSFKTIAENLKTTIENTQKQIDVTVSGFNTTISGQTGGNSYVYFEPIGGMMGPLDVNVPGIPAGYLAENTVMRFVGSYPLHNVFVCAILPYGMVAEH